MPSPESKPHSTLPATQADTEFHLGDNALDKGAQQTGTGPPLAKMDPTSIIALTTIMEEQLAILRRIDDRQAAADVYRQPYPIVGPTSGGVWNSLFRAKLDMIQPVMSRWTGGLDALLVFIGLFSAIVTAFLVDAIKKLSSEDPGMKTNVLLMNLTEVMIILSGRNGSTMEFLRQPEFQPDTNDVRLLSYWAVSLVLSLCIAALAVTTRHFVSKLNRSTGRASFDKLSELWSRWSQAESYLRPAVVVLRQVMVIPVGLFVLGLLDNLFVSALKALPSSIGLLVTVGLSSFLIIVAVCTLLGALMHGIVHESSPFESALRFPVIAVGNWFKAFGPRQGQPDEDHGSMLGKASIGSFHECLQETRDDNALADAASAFGGVVEYRQKNYTRDHSGQPQFILDPYEKKSVMHLLSAEANERTNITAAEALFALHSKFTHDPRTLHNEVDYDPEVYSQPYSLCDTPLDLLDATFEALKRCYPISADSMKNILWECSTLRTVSLLSSLVYGKSKVSKAGGDTKITYSRIAPMLCYLQDNHEHMTYAWDFIRTKVSLDVPARPSPTDHFRAFDNLMSAEGPVGFKPSQVTNIVTSISDLGDINPEFLLRHIGWWMLHHLVYDLTALHEWVKEHYIPEFDGLEDEFVRAMIVTVLGQPRGHVSNDMLSSLVDWSSSIVLNGYSSIKGDLRALLFVLIHHLPSTFEWDENTVENVAMVYGSSQDSVIADSVWTRVIPKELWPQEEDDISFQPPSEVVRSDQEELQDRVSFYRAFANDYPIAFQGDLAKSLDELAAAIWGSDSDSDGDSGDVCRLMEEAIELQQKVVAYDSSNSASLSLARMCLRLTDYTPTNSIAVEKSTLAVELYRTKIKTVKSRKRLLANALHRQAVYLTRQGDLEEAVDSSTKACSFYRAIWHCVNSEGRTTRAFAEALSVLGRELSQLRRDDECISVSEEAINVYRCLEQNNNTRKSYATMLSVYARSLTAAGRFDDAIARAHEAVTNFRDSGCTPQRLAIFILYVAEAISTSSSEEVLKLHREAVGSLKEHFRDGAVDEEVGRALSTSLLFLARHLRGNGRHDESRQAIRGAVDQYRKWKPVRTSGPSTGSEADAFGAIEEALELNKCDRSPSDVEKFDVLVDKALDIFDGLS